MAKKATQHCPVVRTLDAMGERWTPLLLRDLLLHGARRFQDFQDSLEGIAPTTLSDRLKTLERHGIVERRFYTQHPPRAEYVLTRKGRDLGPVVRAMRDWGEKYRDKPRAGASTAARRKAGMTGS